MRFFYVFLTEQFECVSNCIDANRYLQHIASNYPRHLLLDFAERYFEAISKRELLLNTFEKLLSFPCLSQV